MKHDTPENSALIFKVRTCMGSTLTTITNYHNLLVNSYTSKQASIELFLVAALVDQ